LGFQKYHEVFPVRQFQFIQEDRHTVIAKMYADGRPSAEQEAKLAAFIQKA
jgi:hypothetical protein